MENNIDNIKCSVEFITPDLAEQYLGFNESNRNLNRKRVALYAKDMASGNWQLNGEPICFFCDGELKDGQHRLSAIKLSGIGQWMTVVRGISKNAMIHDRGQSRTTLNTLNIYGYPTDLKNTAIIGAIKLMQYIVSRNTVRMTDTEIMSVIDNNRDEFRSAYELAKRGKNHPPMLKAAGVAAVFCALHNGMSESKVEEFCKIANTGFCDDETKFAAVLARNAITAPAVNNETYRIQLFRTVLLALQDFNNDVPRKRAYTVFKPTEWETKALQDVIKNPTAGTAGHPLPNRQQEEQ